MKRKKKRRKEKNRDMVGKKVKWKAKKSDLVVTILGIISNRAWKGFQNQWDNIHPCKIH